MGLPEYLKQRTIDAQQKVKLIEEHIATHPDWLTVDFPSLMDGVRALLKRNKLDMINTAGLRKLRHHLREKAGLPFDGLAYPDKRSADASYLLRRQIAFQIARERRGVITGVDLREEVRKRTGGTRTLGAAATVEILRKVKREVLKASTQPHSPEQEALPLASPTVAGLPAIPWKPIAAPPIGLSGDTQAALDLLVPALRADGVSSMTILLSQDGTASYSAEKRAVTSLSGTVKG